MPLRVSPSARLVMQSMGPVEGPRPWRVTVRPASAACFSIMSAIAANAAGAREGESHSIQREMPATSSAVVDSVAMSRFHLRCPPSGQLLCRFELLGVQMAGRPMSRCDVHEYRHLYPATRHGMRAAGMEGAAARRIQ